MRVSRGASPSTEPLPRQALLRSRPTAECRCRRSQDRWLTPVISLTTRREADGPQLLLFRQRERAWESSPQLHCFPVFDAVHRVRGSLTDAVPLRRNWIGPVLHRSRLAPLRATMIRCARCSMRTCLADMVAPSVSRAARAVLERGGVEVEVPRGQTCCGQPACSSGHPDQAAPGGAARAAGLRAATSRWWCRPAPARRWSARLPRAVRRGAEEGEARADGRAHGRALAVPRPRGAGGGGCRGRRDR